MKTKKQLVEAFLKRHYKQLLNEMSYEQAKAEAKRISKEEGVVQHVNEVGKNEYEVSDWYDSESTVISYENGIEK